MRKMVNCLLGLPKQIYLLLTLIFFNAMIQLVTIVGTLYFHDYGYSTDSIGIMISCFGIGSVIGGYLGGICSDIFSAKSIIIISLLGNVISLILLPFQSHILGFCFILFAIGFFNSGFRPSSIIALLEYKHVIKEMSLLSYRRVALNIGYSLGASVFGFLYDIKNMLPFIVMSAILTLNLIIACFLSSGFPLCKAPKASNGSVQTQKHSGLFAFIFLNLLLLVMMIIFNQNQTTYPIFLSSHGLFSAADVSLIFAFSGIIIVVCQIPVGHFFDKKTLSTTCFVGALLLSFGIGLTLLISNIYIALLLCVLWTFGEMILFPALLPYMLRSSPYKKGNTIGIYQLSFSAAGFVAPLVGTKLYVISPSLLWSLCLTVGCLCAFCFILLNSIKGY